MFEDVRALLFDVGDTLYVSSDMEEEYPRMLLQLISTSRGVSLAQADTMLEAASKGLKGRVKHVTKVRAMAELGFTRAQVHEAFCRVDPRRFLKPDPALAAMLADLSRHYKLGVISNFKRSHLKEITDTLGIPDGTFIVVVTEDIVEEIKPAPEPFLKAAAIAGVPTSQCVYIADSPTKDIWPAKEVGMKTILVSERPEAKDLEYADASIRNIYELAALLHSGAPLRAHSD